MQNLLRSWIAFTFLSAQQQVVMEANIDAVGEQLRTFQDQYEEKSKEYDHLFEEFNQTSQVQQHPKHWETCFYQESLWFPVIWFCWVKAICLYPKKIIKQLLRDPVNIQITSFLMCCFNRQLSSKFITLDVITRNFKAYFMIALAVKPQMEE